MVAARKWTPAKTLGSLNEWLNDPYNRRSLFDEARESLQKYLSNSLPPSPLSTIGLWLDDIATWYLYNGCVSTLTNKTSGLQELHLSASYAGWGLIAVSSHLATVKPKPSPGLLLNDESLVLATHLALGMKADASRLGARIISGLEQEMYAPESNCRVAPFVLRLFCSWQNVPYPERAMTKFALVAEPYERLLHHLWETDTRKLEELVYDTCDFHISRSKPSTDRQTFEFDQDAFWAFPVEILAALRAREQQGLALPPLEHPLLNTPLGRLPPVAQPVVDPLLEAVVAKARGALLLS